MSHAEDIEQQAAEWLVRRDRGLKGSSDFTAWLAADPRHRAAYLRITAAWERTGNLKRLAPEGAPVDRDLLSPEPRWRLRGTPWRPLAVAAVLCTVALAALWTYLADRGVETYRTQVGGLSRVVLADGSTVTLNTDSELRVHLSPHRREITLLRGEAHFAVSHDPERPFEVSAAGRRVIAVGTAFDVRLDANQGLQVMVTEGRVAVEEAVGAPSSQGPPVTTVSAGEAATARLGKLTVSRVSSAESSRRLAWQTGELSFQGETLEQAAAEFNRYNRRKLRIEDPAIAQLQVGGNFHALDVESFVAAVERSFDLTARAEGDGTLVLERAGSPGRP